MSGKSANSFLGLCVGDDWPVFYLKTTFMISIQHLSKTFYAGRLEIRAAADVSFDVAPGEVYGLLGPNGAGKTTMMRMILGLLKPDEGYAEIAGHRSDHQPDEVKRQVGFVSAAAGVYQWLTGREMLGFFGEIYGLSEGEVKTRIQELSSILDLAGFIDGFRVQEEPAGTGRDKRVEVGDRPIFVQDSVWIGKG